MEHSTAAAMRMFHRASSAARKFRLATGLVVCFSLPGAVALHAARARRSQEKRERKTQYHNGSLGIVWNMCGTAVANTRRIGVVKKNPQLS